LLKKLFITVDEAAQTITSEASAISALWTLLFVIDTTMFVDAPAETAQFLISQGLALASLASLCKTSEFSVEAATESDAGKDPNKVHLASAIFTGSIWTREELRLTKRVAVALNVNRSLERLVKLSGLREESRLHSVRRGRIISGIILGGWIQSRYSADLKSRGSLTLAQTLLRMFLTCEHAPITGMRRGLCFFPGLVVLGPPIHGKSLLSYTLRGTGHC